MLTNNTEKTTPAKEYMDFSKVVDIEQTLEQKQPISSGLIKIETKDGNVMEVHDIRSLPEALDKGSGFYGYEAASNNTSYVTFGILYSSFDDSFAVSLTREPLKIAREDAQKFLMKSLNIDEAGVCKLRAFVSVPAEINLQLAGKDLGFSFCPGSVEL